MKLGYACINTELTERGVSSNRGMIKRTFQAKGVNYASEIALANVRALKEIIQWNADNDIHVYRMSSLLFPWMSEYEIQDLPDIDLIKTTLLACGKLARQHAQRLSFHPGPYNVLCSPKDNVVDKTIKELNRHSEIMDLMGLPRSPYAKINIHLGGAYGDHAGSMQRFCDNFQRLDEGTKARLTVENDDKPSMYSTKMLYEGVHKVIGIPIVFDSHHFSLGPQDQTYEEAFYLARKTWEGTGVKQICHHSNSRRKYDDPKAKPVAHSDLIHERFENFGEDIDLVLEAKKKELAIKHYPKS